MDLIVSNNLQIKNPSQAIKDYCNTVLTLDNPQYINAVKMGRYTGKMDAKMKLYYVNGDTYILPFGCLQDIWRLGTYNYTLEFCDFKALSMVGGINLYDYQEKALKSLLKGKNGVLSAPCGSGKTNIGLQLIKEIGGKALWLTHTKELLKQSLERCKEYFKGDFGTITEGQINIGKDITFATVQTMCKIDKSIYENEFNTIIVDECHHCVGTPTKVMSFYKVLSNCKSRYKYGLSATLNRSDNLISCVYSILGKKLYTISESDVGDKIIRAKYMPIMIDLKYNMKSYTDTDGTINYNKLIELLSFNSARDKYIIDKIVENLGKKQLILCHRVLQANGFQAQLKALGIDSQAITGNVKHRVFDKDIIISTYSLAKEGLDMPELEILHLATPQKNKSVTKQAVGRVERNIVGKNQPICYDYVDTDISYCMKCYYQRKRILQ